MILELEKNFTFVAEENNEIFGIVNGTLVDNSGLSRLGWIDAHSTTKTKE